MRCFKRVPTVNEFSGQTPVNMAIYAHEILGIGAPAAPLRRPSGCDGGTGG